MLDLNGHVLYKVINAIRDKNSARAKISINVLQLTKSINRLLF